MNITFRCDASIDIGTGHVMRCLTLANALRAQGAECRFICREHNSHLIDKIQSDSHAIDILPVADAAVGAQDGEPTLAHAAWLGATQAQDAQACEAIIEKHQPDWLIVDHYALDRRWESRQRPHCGKIMVIDDLANRKHLCDILLDQNMHVDAATRYRALVPQSCRMLLGPSHAVLRPEFCARGDVRARRTLQRVFVYMGSGDVFNQAGCAMLALKTFKGLQADIVLGDEHPYLETVLATAAGCTNMNIMTRCDRMAEYMLRADIALGVCGVNAWERCALGLPSVVCITADNQRDDAVLMHQYGAALNLGDAEDVGRKTWMQALARFVKRPDRLHGMSRAAAALVKGHCRNFDVLIHSIIDA